MQPAPGGWGQERGGWVGAGGGGRWGTPQQVAPVGSADGLSLLLDGGADQEGEDEPVSLEQASAHLQNQACFLLCFVTFGS